MGRFVTIVWAAAAGVWCSNFRDAVVDGQPIMAFACIAVAGLALAMAIRSLSPSGLS